MRESQARALRLKPLGLIRGYAAAAIDIQREPLLIGPAYAIPRALSSAGISWSDLDLVEIHEAFAAQVLATVQAIESRYWAKEKLGLDRAIGSVDPTTLNVNGGSIPLGHPFGATGGRLILQTLHELRQRKKSLGLISVCAAGGLGTVMVVEALD
jgi:acetyl-CoA acyltransferase